MKLCCLATLRPKTGRKQQVGHGSVKGHGVWEKTLPLPTLKSHKAWLQILTATHISEGHTDAISLLCASVSTVKTVFIISALRGLLTILLQMLCLAAPTHLSISRISSLFGWEKRNPKSIALSDFPRKNLGFSDYFEAEPYKLIHIYFTQVK